MLERQAFDELAEEKRLDFEASLAKVEVSLAEVNDNNARLEWSIWRSFARIAH